MRMSADMKTCEQGGCHKTLSMQRRLCPPLCSVAELLEVVSWPTCPASLDAATASAVRGHDGYAKVAGLLLRQLEVGE